MGESGLRPRIFTPLNPFRQHHIMLHTKDCHSCLIFQLPVQYCTTKSLHQAVFLNNFFNASATAMIHLSGTNFHFKLFSLCSRGLSLFWNVMYICCDAQDQRFSVHTNAGLHGRKSKSAFPKKCNYVVCFSLCAASSSQVTYRNDAKRWDLNVCTQF